MSKEKGKTKREKADIKKVVKGMEKNNIESIDYSAEVETKTVSCPGGKTRSKGKGRGKGYGKKAGPIGRHKK